MLIFHIGLKEPPRSCTFSGQAAVKGSKRRADNWIHWFKEIQFYQVCKKTSLHKELMLQEKRLFKQDCFWHGNIRSYNFFGIVTLFRLRLLAIMSEVWIREERKKGILNPLRLW